MSHPPWQKNLNVQNFQQQMSLQFNQQLNAAATYGFQQQNPAFANLTAMNLNLNQQPIQYPPRVNAIAFQQQQQQSAAQSQSNQMQSGQQSSKYNAAIKSFSGTGCVTKIQNDIGFIDEEVLFHKNVCVNGVPKVRDLVLVEATFNAKMPFKWNATRVQILSAHQPASAASSSSMLQDNKSYNNPSQRESVDNNSRRNRYSEERERRARDERRARSREHTRGSGGGDDDDRKRRREEERNERDRRATERRDTKSPKRRRTAIVPRYMVQMPKISLSLLDIDVLEARRRYPNLYVPSDFLFSENKWINAFQPQKPFTLNRPCTFHIIKDVNAIDDSAEKAVLDPPDADYSYSAKVMLMSLPTTEEIYKKCIVRAEDKDGKFNDYYEKDFIHPTRLINFLVGVVRGKSDSMAIGGPWSKKLDGENPDTDPSVLIKTAIRTCKALTGIDLSKCTQWYRFLELKYRRSEQTKGESIVKPARIETVVIFLPDIYSCMPNRSEWEILQHQYKQACEKFICDPDSDDDVQIISGDDEKLLKQPTIVDANVGGVSIDAKIPDNSSSDSSNGEQKTLATIDEATSSSSLPANDVEVTKAETTQDGADESAMQIDVADKPSENIEDIKNLKVTELRAELAARNLSTKGLKHELIERLQNVLNNQSSETSLNTDVLSSEPNDDVEMTVDEKLPPENLDNNDDSKEQDTELNISEMDMSEVTVIDEYDSTKDDKPKQAESSDAKKKKPDVKKKKFDEKEKQAWEKKYQLPDNSPSIIVHPSKTAKGGKFDCQVVSLSLLLDYTSKDTKEHSFEISLFAEAFNEMLTRDFGFKIYKAFNYLNGCNTSDDKSKDTIDDAEKVQDEKKSESGEKKSGGSVKKNEDSDSDQSRNRREKESKDKIKYVTAYPDLLLSFCYFDQTQCGYIFEKDLEELFYCLGLSLSRSQVRKLLEKFITRDSLYYRKITDRPATTTVDFDPLQNIPDEQLSVLALGNNRTREATASIPQNTENNEIVTIDGIIVNVQQILNQMKRAESAYEESERIVAELRKSNTELKSTNHRNEKKIKDLSSDLKSYSRKLQDAESGLNSMTRKYNDCYSVISSVYDRVTPIIRSKEKSRDRERKSDKKSVKEEKTNTDKSEKKTEKATVVEEKDVKEEKSVEGEEDKKSSECKIVEEDKKDNEEP